MHLFPYCSREEWHRLKHVCSHIHSFWYRNLRRQSVRSFHREGDGEHVQFVTALHQPLLLWSNPAELWKAHCRLLIVVWNQNWFKRCVDDKDRGWLQNLVKVSCMMRMPMRWAGKQQRYWERQRDIERMQLRLDEIVATDDGEEESTKRTSKLFWGRLVKDLREGSVIWETVPRQTYSNAKCERQPVQLL